MITGYMGINVRMLPYFCRVQEEGVEVEITRYALVGSSTPRTISVKGRVKTVCLVNLLDFRFWKYS